MHQLSTLTACAVLLGVYALGCGVPEIQTGNTSNQAQADSSVPNQPPPQSDLGGSWFPGDGLQPDPVNPPPSQPGPGQPPGPGVDPTCVGKPGPKGLAEYPLMIVHQGQPRLALVHIPASYDGTKPFGLIFNAHGQTFSAPTQAKMSRLSEVADKYDYITVVPQGTGGLLAGYNCGNAPMKQVYANVDDVDFVRTLIDSLSKSYCIDPKKIHATGFSIGGAFAYKLACDLSDKIASFSSVSGPDATVTCNPTRPLALLHFHGTADTFASYDNDGDMNIGATTYVARHAKRIGCSPAQKVTLQKGAVTCKTYDQNCKEGTEATLCTIQGGTHNWPGGNGWLLGGAINKDVDASQMMVDFFRKHPMP